MSNFRAIIFRRIHTHGNTEHFLISLAARSLDYVLDLAPKHSQEIGARR
jgi:hypothetical protein